MKSLWRGAFLYNDDISSILYAYAQSKEQARVIMCQRLAKKDGVHPSVVLSKFPVGSDNFSIELEMEVKEA